MGDLSITPLQKIEKTLERSFRNKHYVVLNKATHYPLWLSHGRNKISSLGYSRKPWPCDYQLLEGKKKPLIYMFVFGLKRVDCLCGSKCINVDLEGL